MPNIVKIALSLGVLFNLLGSFLPWQREGDFISYVTYGIQIFPQFKDNGGLLIVLLILSLLVLIYKPHRLIRQPLVWRIVLSLALVIISGFHIAQWFISRMNAPGILSAPQIEVGLVMVSIGSILLFLASLVYYQDSKQ